MAAGEFRGQLVAFFQEHNPEKISNVDAIVKKYAGKEAQLLKHLAKKYAPAARAWSREEEQLLQQAARSTGNWRRWHDVAERMPAPGRSARECMFHYTAALRAAAAAPGHAGLAQLNFSSPLFDPFMALCMKVVPPCPGMVPLDNVSKARAFLPAGHEHACKTVVMEHRDSVTSDKRLKEIAKYKKAPGEDRPMHKALSSIAATAAQVYGPLSLLLTCFTDKRRVCVTIRRVNRVHGTCTGLLRAFDKHMNMVLADVVEGADAKYRGLRFEV
eukprot:g885.t1